MTAFAPAPHTATHPDEQAHRLTRRAYWMLATFVGAYIVTSFVGLYVVIPLLGLSEGDLFLFARDVAGWAFEILFLLLVLSPLALGVVFAARALRHGARAGAWTALLLNAFFALVMLYTFLDAIRMTYWPEWTFPFGA
jgi:hypothetical protein